jgi:cytochrome c553
VAVECISKGNNLFYFFIFVLLLPTSLFAQQPEPVAELAVECNVCHVASEGKLRSLYGIPTDEFINLVQQYQSGERSMPLMSEAVQDLDAETLKALAEYYATTAKN